MKQAKTCLNFDSNSITMLGKKFQWNLLHLVTTASLLPNLSQIEVCLMKYFLLEKLQLKNRSEKKLELHRQFSHPNSTNIHSATMWGYRMLFRRPAWGDEREEKWRERVRDIRATSTTWWWWIIKKTINDFELMKNFTRTS